MKTGLIYTLLVVNVLVFYILTIQSINKGYLPDLIKGRGERITTGDYYSLQIDKKRNYLLAAQHEKSKLVVFDIKKNPPLKVFEKKILTEELECFRINPERNEFYHFDRGENKLLVYDLQTFTLKRESSSNTAGKGNATLAYDNHSKTISVGREGKGNSIWLFDMDTAEPIHEIKKLGFRTESNRYSQILKKYVITHYFDSPNITVVNPNDYRSQVINAFFFQADLAESLQHEKLYVAFPIEGLIRVIDLKSFGRIKKHKPEIREYISTVHGVRKIAYDETNDLLLAASTNNGYVDIIKPATGKILKRMFVGYYLREIALYENRREAYIASQIGGIYKINY